MGVMKYFRHILMGHEIFFKTFDGPWNIFLSSIFIILFFKLKRLMHKTSKLAIKEIYERHDMLNKSHPLSRYKTNSGKNKKKNVRCILTLMLWPLFLAIDTRFSLVILSVWLHFSIIVWANRLHDFDEGICFPGNCCYENG